MKKITIKLSALLLALVLVLSSLAACSSTGKPLLTLGKTELSENVYMLFLSRLKGSMSSASNYSSDALTDAFWDTVVANDGTTREQKYKDQILEESKLYVAAMALFDELGLKLPDSYVEEIDSDLSDLLEGDADGSKTAFNALLSAYGANYDVLREAYLLEAKLSYLNEYLYGSNGSKIGNEIINEYYKANYVRFKHIFFYTFDIVYETDDDGNDIYYTESGDGRIAYDTSALKRRDKDGKEVKDAKGDVVYENSDGSVAYDRKNGQRKPTYDANGRVITRDFTKDELIAVSDQATLMMEELEKQTGNYTLFDSYVEKYSEDEGSLTYSNGFYMTAESNYDSPEVLKAVLEMKEGEIRKIHSDYGIHIVMKYELEENGYGLSANSDFFVNANTGAYVFINDVTSALLYERLSKSISEVVVDKERYNAVSIKSLGANYYY